MILQIGSLISFSYRGLNANDPYPEVLVLHPSWRYWPNRAGGKPLVHGLNFNYLTDDEINIIRMIVDPGFQLKYFENMQMKNPGIAAEFDRIIGAAGNANISSPHDFYLRVIKPFIRPRGYDPYRLYDPGLMQNVRMLQTPQQFTGMNRVSMFGNTQPRGSGKTEQQIISDLALKKAQEEKTGIKQLTPAETQLLSRLQGQALALFNSYKLKFKNAKGPTMPTRAPNFAGNQKQGTVQPTNNVNNAPQTPKLPKFMNNPED